MRVEMTRTYPVTAKEAFDYLNDYRTWPDWYTGMTEIVDPEHARWIEPGDTVRFAYKMLGRRVEGICTLQEVREAELVRFVAAIPAIGDVHQEWTYYDAGEHAVAVKVWMESEGPTTFFGKAIDTMLVPRIVERDLRHTLDHLEEIFTVGIPK